MSDKRRSRVAAPMAAEDELLLLQSKALAEEEEAKTKGEMLTRFLKVRGGPGGRRWQHITPHAAQLLFHVLTAHGPCAGQAGQGGAQQHPEPPQAQDAVADGVAGGQG